MCNKLRHYKVNRHTYIHTYRQSDIQKLLPELKNNSLENYRAYITGTTLDDETVDIFEAVDDKLVDEKEFNDVTRTKQAQSFFSVQTPKFKLKLKLQT